MLGIFGYTRKSSTPTPTPTSPPPSPSTSSDSGTMRNCGRRGSGTRSLTLTGSGAGSGDDVDVVIGLDAGIEVSPVPSPADSPLSSRERRRPSFGASHQGAFLKARTPSPLPSYAAASDCSTASPFQSKTVTGAVIVPLPPLPRPNSPVRGHGTFSASPPLHAPSSSSGIGMGNVCTVRNVIAFALVMTMVHSILGMQGAFLHSASSTMERYQSSMESNYLRMSSSFNVRNRMGNGDGIVPVHRQYQTQDSTAGTPEENPFGADDDLVEDNVQKRGQEDGAEDANDGRVVDDGDEDFEMTESAQREAIVWLTDCVTECEVPRIRHLVETATIRPTNDGWDSDHTPAVTTTKININNNNGLHRDVWALHADRLLQQDDASSYHSSQAQMCRQNLALIPNLRYASVPPLDGNTHIMVKNNTTGKDHQQSSESTNTTITTTKITADRVTTIPWLQRIVRATYLPQDHHNDYQADELELRKQRGTAQFISLLNFIVRHDYDYGWMVNHQLLFTGEDWNEPFNQMEVYRRRKHNRQGQQHQYPPGRRLGEQGLISAVTKAVQNADNKKSGAKMSVDLLLAVTMPASMKKEGDNGLQEKCSTFDSENEIKHCKLEDIPWHFGRMSNRLAQELLLVLAEQSTPSSVPRMRLGEWMKQHGFSYRVVAHPDILVSPPAMHAQDGSSGTGVAAVPSSVSSPLSTSTTKTMMNNRHRAEIMKFHSNIESIEPNQMYHSVSC